MQPMFDFRRAAAGCVRDSLRRDEDRDRRTVRQADLAQPQHRRGGWGSRTRMSALLRAAAIGSLALAIGIPDAPAKTLGQATNTEGWDEFGEDEIAIPLKKNGATTITFKTEKDNTLVVATYNAECAVLGPPSSRLSIRITVDGVDTNPKAGINFAFCAATNGTNKIYTAVSRQAVITVPTAGTHTVQVFGVLPDGAIFASVDDTSIVIQD
jgi:hypothetical protein